jgi:26S proteasome regulatory subunit N7
MPAKITDEEKLPKIPNLDVAQWKFYLKSHPKCEKTQKAILKEIKEKAMAPFYAEMCADFNQPPDQELMAELRKKNLDTLAEKDKKIAEAEEMEGTNQTLNFEDKKKRKNIIKVHV